MSDTPTENSAHGEPDMTDPAPVPHAPHPATTTDDLVRHLQQVVLDTPRVATLVPTMTTAFTRLRRRRQTRPNQPTSNNSSSSQRDREHLTPGDGVTVTVEGNAVTAVLDITVDPTASVLATALAVRSAAAAALEIAHAGAYTVKVNVLDLEASPDDKH